ncbi:hypothetical protein ILUMI_07924 [Ignelater luminosus]|uniref:Sodium channel protein Nach n=1 Tax=Ignelater luminosus TaxID=2038154 RepID=A0A8K0D2K5_IGNLU|nr:hypothetical protein ILUMI_07924 [Ignelater luminosus]
MWFCCISVGAVATMVIIVSLWEKFQTNPTITGLDTDFHNWDVPFPALTLCPSIPSNITVIQDYIERKMSDVKNKKDLTEFLQKLSLFSYEILADFKKYTSKGYVSNTTNLRDFIFELMIPCEEMYEDCVWKADNYNCCKGFFPVFTESGFCYSFNSRHYEKKIPRQAEELPPFNMRYIQETDIKWSLKFTMLDSSDGIKFPLYIHNADEVPGIDMQPQHIWDFKVDRISFSVKQTYTTDDTRQLSIKQRKCIFENEVKLKIDHMYTYTACTRQCRMETAKRYCGCVPFFYPEIENFRHCRIHELACIADHLGTIKSVDRCNCQLGCSNTVYEVEKLNEHGSTDDVNRGLEAEFVSWPMVRYKREVLFGWVDLLVSFGGIAGLFLGFSLLSGVELIYYFTIRACCMVYLEPQELERLQREEVVKLKPSYDLSLVPYFIRTPVPISGIHEVAKGYFGFNLTTYTNNQIKPITVKRKNKNLDGEIIYPPFGIEFLP